MNKATIITEIKNIIAEWGSFNTAEVNAESSPCITTLGQHTCQLAESFSAHKVEAVTYVHENETATDYIPYENLKMDVLKEIQKLAKDYEKQQIEENA